MRDCEVLWGVAGNTTVVPLEHFQDLIMVLKYLLQMDIISNVLGIGLFLLFA
jgi:hypothetical protein